MSLRINDLPSNAERQKAFLDAAQSQRTTAISPIPEVSPQQLDTVSEFCKELSQGLSLLTNNKDSDDFLNFERLANGIISGTVSIPANIPSPPATVASPVTSHYRPLVSVPNTSIPVGTAIPMQHHKNDDLIPTRFNSLVAVTTQSTTSTTFSTDIFSSPAPKTPPSSPQKVVPIETVTPLPKAEQWLTEIVKKTSPSPRRPPHLQSRSKSLATESLFGKRDWSPETKTTEIHSTNPFISPAKPTVTQTFQVQL
jgi:numb